MFKPLKLRFKNILFMTSIYIIMERNHNQNRFRNRVMDMYRDLIALSNMNCTLTNNTIQQVETGIRELLRNDILNSNSRHSSIPIVNTQ
jgi:hypothetical protein